MVPFSYALAVVLKSSGAGNELLTQRSMCFTCVHFGGLAILDPRSGRRIRLTHLQSRPQQLSISSPDCRFFRFFRFISLSEEGTANRRVILTEDVFQCTVVDKQGPISLTLEIGYMHSYEY